MGILLMDAVCDEKDSGLDVDLEKFRGALAVITGTRLTIESDGRHVQICSDDRPVGSLLPAPPNDESQFSRKGDTESAVLPTNFANFVQQAFTCASTDVLRRAITGVNISPRGIAGTDGRQLFHLPLPLRLKTDVTIPPSKVYAALKHLRWTSLSHWKNIGGEPVFEVEGEGFRYTAKALNVRYPDYMQVIPDRRECDVSFSLTPEGANEMLSFVSVGKGDSFADMTVHPARIELLEERDNEGTRRTGVFGARSANGNLPCTIPLNTAYLRQFLKMGFTAMSLSSKGPAPLMSTSGTGQYLFMPCRAPSAQCAPDASPNPIAESKPVIVSNSPATNNQTNNKEKKTMTQTITTANPAVAVPTQYPRAIQQPAAQANPLDETLASITAMREQLANLETRLLEAARKIKAALLEQRQKERQFADATHKLERIRLAV